MNRLVGIQRNSYLDWGWVWGWGNTSLWSRGYCRWPWHWNRSNMSIWCSKYINMNQRNKTIPINHSFHQFHYLYCFLLDFYNSQDIPTRRQRTIPWLVCFCVAGAATRRTYWNLLPETDKGWTLLGTLDKLMLFCWLDCTRDWFWLVGYGTCCTVAWK